MSFKSDLEDLLNTHNIDSECNMPDYQLADYIIDVLNTLKVQEIHVDGVKDANRTTHNGTATYSSDK